MPQYRLTTKMAAKLKITNLQKPPNKALPFYDDWVIDLDIFNRKEVAAKLKPYPKYKDSGIEWLGDVPEGWTIKKLKFVGDSIIGLTYSPDDVTDGSFGTLVLRSTNIQNDKISLHENVFVNKIIPPKLMTKCGDILICARNGSRSLVGKNAMMDATSSGLTFGAFTAVYRSYGVNNKYLYWVFNSSLFDCHSGSFLTTTINQLTTGNINSFETPLPSYQQQTTIANYLDTQTAKIDKLIENYQKLIELSKEKRTALITAAVTGKIDVRECV